VTDESAAGEVRYLTYPEAAEFIHRLCPRKGIGWAWGELSRALLSQEVRCLVQGFEPKGIVQGPDGDIDVFIELKPFGQKIKRRYRRDDLMISEDHLQLWLINAGLIPVPAAPIAASPAPAKVGSGRRGRKCHLVWPEVENEVFRLMDHHGDFRPDDPKWNCQERLIEALDRFNISRSSLAEAKHIPAMVAKWRIRKSEN
jgi:hypothetical protein